MIAVEQMLMLRLVVVEVELVSKYWFYGGLSNHAGQLQAVPNSTSSCSLSILSEKCSCCCSNLATNVYM
jgi:hypothetical protein